MCGCFRVLGVGGPVRNNGICYSTPPNEIKVWGSELNLKSLPSPRHTAVRSTQVRPDARWRSQSEQYIPSSFAFAQEKINEKISSLITVMEY